MISKLLKLFKKKRSTKFVEVRDIVTTICESCFKNSPDFKFCANLDIYNEDLNILIRVYKRDIDLIMNGLKINLNDQEKIFLVEAVSYKLNRYKQKLKNELQLHEESKVQLWSIML